MKKRAFTLAEVLIALTIIGVTAAITIPALIQRTNKQEYVTDLQKAYSTLSQAANMIIAEEGSPKSTCEDCNDGWAYSTENIYNLYKKYLINVKDCAKKGGCFKQGNAYNLNSKSKDGSPLNSSSYYSLILSSGAEIAFIGSNSLCIGNNRLHEALNSYCGVILTDINGVKGPNMLGRDIFLFLLKEHGLLPAGCDIENACTNEEAGWGCACRVLREGAMNY